MMSFDDNKRQTKAISFLDALKKLKCIEDDGSLHKISSFCDHTVEIFNAFPKGFLFLPDEYKSNDIWLPFFRDLDLKQSVTQNEFLQFCHETASSKMSNAMYCSKVLLDYLFSPQVCTWECNFLARVSDIAFVFQENLPRLNWVVPGIFPVGQMVKLRGSALLSRATLLWTLKPIVKLPTFSTAAIEKRLGISRNPSCADVVANIQNICKKSQYAQQGLFSIYPPDLVCPPDKDNLLHIMTENLTYLDHNLKTPTSSSLGSLPCIPVFNTIGPQASETSIVLVKPCQVVCDKWNKADVLLFHPYLHCLPEELWSIPNLLQQIGVKKSLELCHIQVVLERAHEASEGAELDINTEKCVKEAIRLLGERFLKSQDSSIGKTLSPLYLPDSGRKLKKSTSLLYGDTVNYWKKIELDLSDVPYSYFDIKTADYKIQAPTFCRLLPESVRPIGLSTVCKQIVLDTCEKTGPSDVAEQLQNLIEVTAFPVGIVTFLNRYIGKQENEDSLKELIREYLRKMEVVTVIDLKVQIVLTESNKRIGILNTKFCYVPGDVKSTLYLDSSLRYPVHNDDAYSDVATDMCKKLCESMKVDTTAEQENEITHMIKICLKASCESHLLEILSEYGVEIDGQMHDFQKRLGEVVPQCWHHRLDQDIDNVFNPMEYVGYENRGRIIVAQIVHPVAFDNGRPNLEMKYRIYVEEDDAEGIDVSILSLYKFLVGPKKVKLQPAVSSDERGLAPFDEEAEIPKLRSNLIDKDLIGVMKKICNQLREIWKLPVELRKKALKRLFLTWHPDKNDNPDRAEKIFKFLMKQIEHLDKNEPLDDPEADTKAYRYTSGSYWSSGSYRRRRYRGGFYSGSRFNFHDWGRTADSHGSASDFEDDYFGNGGSSSYTNRTTSDYYPFYKPKDEKNLNEGRRWVLEAKAEFKILTVLHSQLSACSGYNYVCFMAHQVAEKALKGGVYALCGMDGRSLIDHNLSRHAFALETTMPERTQGLAQHAVSLDGYYLKTRYPNQWPGYTDIPLDHYTQADADKAKEDAKTVLDVVIGVMPCTED